MARTAKRLALPGSSVKVVYRRTRSEMPADVDEIKALLAEGIEMHELLAPERLITDQNRITGLQCTRMQLVKSENDSRLTPVKVEGEFIELQVDTLIPALGQETDIDFASAADLKTQQGSYATSVPGVFIGGDALRGAATIVKAVGDGRKAAIQIAAKAGIVLPSEILSSDKKMSYSDFIIRKSQRQKMAAAIAGDHPEFTAESAIREASRCLQCGDVCSVCVTVCPNRANNYYLTEAAEVPVWKISFNGDAPTFRIESQLKIQQKYQVLNVADFCNECGNCTTFCPTKGSPFSDKPRICLTEKSFHQTDNSFLFQQEDNTSILLHRTGDEVSRLSKTHHSYQFSNSRVNVSFSAADFSITKAETSGTALAEIILSEAAEMKILLDTIPYTFLKTQHHATKN
ncbi:MAG: hypothetical protein U0Z17_00820 [Bacteroidales bacterium]